ncbi:MAG TPA: hypothetical protein VME47_17345 [Acetobacteraceae bacterium]|nr:hypothetical protein [Acetobacteraceae bacterium]
MLHITWQDGSRTRHDLAAMIRDRDWAAALRNPGVFAAAQIQGGGWQVVWPGTDTALSATGLWDDVHPPAPAARFMSSADLTAWLHELGLSFVQASAALGVSVRMLKYYAAGTHEIPKTVWLACMHLAAEHARRRARPGPASSARSPRGTAQGPGKPPLRASGASAISRAAGTRPPRLR